MAIIRTTDLEKKDPEKLVSSRNLDNDLVLKKDKKKKVPVKVKRK